MSKTNTQPNEAEVPIEKKILEKVLELEEKIDEIKEGQEEIADKLQDLGYR